MKRTQGLFYPLMLFSVGLFLIIIGGLSQGGRHFVKSDFEVVNGILIADADNTGPYFREFFIDAFPGVQCNLRERLLGNDKGIVFARTMRTGVGTELYVTKDGLADVRAGEARNLDVYGLRANGEVLVDIDHFIADQGEAGKRSKFAYFLVGGIMFLGGLLFGISKLKAKTPKLVRIRKHPQQP